MRTSDPQWSSSDLTYIDARFGAMKSDKRELLLKPIIAAFNANAAPINLDMNA
ncbi:MAG: hypothetical protein WCG23_03195 [bacterium]